MKTSRIVLGFARLTDANLEIMANAIFTAMTGNADFPDNPPSLEAFGTALKNFSEAMAASRTRDKVKIAAKNDMRRALQQAMSTLSHYVSYVAQGDRRIHISSGLPVNSATNNPIELGNPQNFSVALGRNSGEVIVSVTRVKGATGYDYFYALAPAQDNAWVRDPRTFSSFVITGLEPGKQYSFRIGITGARGQKASTDIITRLVV